MTLLDPAKEAARSLAAKRVFRAYSSRRRRSFARVAASLLALPLFCFSLSANRRLALLASSCSLAKRTRLAASADTCSRFARVSSKIKAADAAREGVYALGEDPNVNSRDLRTRAAAAAAAAVAFASRAAAEDSGAGSTSADAAAAAAAAATRTRAAASGDKTVLSVGDSTTSDAFFGFVGDFIGDFSVDLGVVDLFGEEGGVLFRRVGVVGVSGLGCSLDERPPVTSRDGDASAHKSFPTFFGDVNGDCELEALPVPSGVLDPGLYPLPSALCARANASVVSRADDAAAVRAAALAPPSPPPNALRAFTMLFPLSTKEFSPTWVPITAEVPTTLITPRSPTPFAGGHVAVVIAVTTGDRRWARAKRRLLSRGNWKPLGEVPFWGKIFRDFWTCFSITTSNAPRRRRRHGVDSVSSPFVRERGGDERGDTRGGGCSARAARS